MPDKNLSESEMENNTETSDGKGSVSAPARSEFTRVSASEFRNHQGSWLDKVVEGFRLTIFRHGKPTANVEASQAILPLEAVISTEDLKRELSVLVQKIEPKDLGTVEIVAKSFVAESGNSFNEGESAEELAKKLNAENLEIVVRIARCFVQENLKSAS